MNNKLSGAIFILFGIGLIVDNTSTLLGDSTETNIKAILYLLLGISSCIYGYKKIRHGYPNSTKEKS